MKQPKIRRPLSQWLEDVRRGPLTALVWGVALVGVVLLIQRRTQPPDFIGLARTLEFNLQAPVDGELESLRVDLYQEVEEGEVLALFDGTELEARIDTAALEIGRLQAELRADEERTRARAHEFGANSDAEMRRFRIDEEVRSLEVLALRVQLEGDRIERDRISLRMRRSQALVDEDIGPEADYDDNRLRHKRLVRTIEENEVLLARTEVALEAAQKRRSAFEEQVGSESSVQTLLAPLSEAIEVQRSRLDGIQLERRRLALRAPARALVSAIHRRPGENVLAGQPVLTLADPTVGEVVVYLPSSADELLTPGTRVELNEQLNPKLVALSTVNRVGPIVETLPARLWQLPGRPEYGRPALIARPSGLELVPGQLVSVRIAR